MRRCYIVSYDIADDKRWRRVYKTMKGYGCRIQYSVFRSELSDLERIKMISELSDMIHHGEDQVLVVDLGPVGGRSEACIKSIGLPYHPPENKARIF